MNDMSPTSMLNSIASKLPQGTSLKLNKVPKLSESEESKSSLSRPVHLSGSPPLKRQRTSSSNSMDMRRKLLGKTLEQKLEHDSSSSSCSGSMKNASDDVFSLSLDEIDEMNPVADEGKSVGCEDPPQAETKSESPKVVVKPAPSKSGSVTNTVQWLQVSRTKRKSRFYKIEATDEEEAFKAVLKASDHTKIPVGLSGKKPFMVVPGIDYGLEYEAGEDCGDGVADEKEIKMIKNEKYFLDSFVCDVGHLSDDELNETPSINKVERRVRRLRRANNIKEKKKIELLKEPEVCGPFWWNGSRGCKKEVKKWQAIVLADLPIPTTFSSSRPSVLMGEDHAIDKAVKEAATVSVAPEVKVAAAAPVVAVEDYELKYHIKYTVKSLVGRRMRGQRSVVSPQGPQDCSTPMVRRPVPVSNNHVPVSRDELLATVSQYPDSILTNNPEMVKKYVSKYHNKFSHL